MSHHSLHLLAPVFAALSGIACRESLPNAGASEPTQARIVAARCAAAKAGSYGATTVVGPITARAKTANVTVCITAAARQLAFASYQGVVTFDSLLASVDSVVQHGAGMRTSNAATAGTLRFAGASAAGMKSGAILTMRLALKRPGRVPAITLSMSELHGANGASLAQQLWVQGKAPARVAARTPNNDGKLVGVAPDTVPRLISLDRESVSNTVLTSGEVVMVTIRAENLDPTNNVLEFGRVRITNVRSDNGGQILRFSVPTTQHTGGEAPPMPLSPGDYLITVQTTRGKTNALRFRITP